MSLESNAFASPRYPIASATLTIPVTMAVNCPSASSGSPVSGLRPYSGVDVPDVGARVSSSSSVVVARGRGALARDRGRDRETPRPRVIASLARVGANAMASRVEVSRWTRIREPHHPARAMTSRDASQTPPSSVNWNALLQWCVSRASSPTHRARVVAIRRPFARIRLER